MAAFCDHISRGVCVVVAASLLVGLAGCSAGVSRFDFPAFNLTGQSQPERVGYQGGADYTTTAAIPVPSEPVYASGQAPGGYQGSHNTYQQYARSEVPPASAAPQAYTPMPTPAAYTPAPSDYTTQTPAQPQAQPAVLRSETATRPAPKPTGPSTTVTVRAGDTLSSIASRHGTSVDAIMAANGLANSRLSVGQTLIVPTGASPSATPGRTYTVQRGDSLYLIAGRHGVDHQLLASHNGLRTTDTLQPGQVLNIPAGGQQMARADTPRRVETPPAPQPVAAASTPDEGVRVVRTTTIPAPAEKEAEEPVRVASTAPEAALPKRAAEESAASPVPGPYVSADDPETSASGDSAVTGTRVASVDALPDPDPMSGTNFRWPVRGRIIGNFGTRPDGGHNDGINVAVPQGTAVQAAENGVVAYAGNELKGYGNLILIRHANNWVSAYAHNDEILVKRGDKVRRGQIIGRAGNTGSVSQPQVHFELRKGSRPVDPVKYLADV